MAIFYPKRYLGDWENGKIYVHLWHKAEASPSLSLPVFPWVYVGCLLWQLLFSRTMAPAPWDSFLYCHLLLKCLALYFFSWLEWCVLSSSLLGFPLAPENNMDLHRSSSTYIFASALAVLSYRHTSFHYPTFDKPAGLWAILGSFIWLVHILQ